MSQANPKAAGHTVRIGGASGALIDSTIGAPQLIEHGQVDYLIFDYMAELATQMYAKAKELDPRAGYSAEFTESIWKDNVRSIAERGIRIVASAGGLNLERCGERMEQLARDAGVALKIALVEGDDLMALVGTADWDRLTDMFDGSRLPRAAQVTSVNAYLGGRAVAEALARGADVVVTGRVADSALALGILMHEFGWTEADHDLLAAGSIAGHIIECGPQATGGVFTDWEDVPDWANIGYPIVECSPDGTFFVTKPAGSGGICSIGTVSEQLLYEIGDPGRYILPDVICDVRNVRLTQAAEDRVQVSGVRGLPATATYKVCGTYTDGFRAVGVLPVVGVDAVAKAERQAAAVFERVNELLVRRGLPKLRTTYVEVLGAEASYGPRSRRRDSREVITKIVAEHDDRAALDIFSRELRTPIITMAPGNTGWFPGQPATAPVVRMFSFLLPKEQVGVSVRLAGERWSVPVPVPAQSDAPPAGPAAEPADDVGSDESVVELPLVRLAWARSGDKGDQVNIAVIAREPAYLPYLRRALTSERVREFFAHDFAGAAEPRVERFDVPGINAVNFLLHEVLGGGGLASVRLDAMGKGKAQQLLEFPVPVPRHIAEALS